jgi:glycosyltransferase involved in cell wall biosynthesis
VNILFVNYGDFTTNSLNHIGPFANELIRNGHDCIVAVPEKLETLRVVPNPTFNAKTFQTLLENPNAFHNGKPADIIHAWTPREIVRRFVISYQPLAHAKCVIHLEDNEDFLTATWLNIPLSDIVHVPQSILREKSTTALSHPRRARAFLMGADAVSIITPSLRDFVPNHIPTLELLPGINYKAPTPPSKSSNLKQTLGINPTDKVIVFTGSNTFANASEMRDLYLAVGLLNERKIPTKLIRTGFTLEKFQASLPASVNEHIIELGFIEKEKLPELLALADVLVQPGKPGPFNDFRLPSKVPEFLSAGKPVILPESNIGLKLRHGFDALLLKTGTPEEIAENCVNVFQNKGLSETLGTNALAFAHRHFDLQVNTRGLIDLYTTILTSTEVIVSKTTHLHMNENELSLIAKKLVITTKSTPLEKEAEALSALINDTLSDLTFNTQRVDQLSRDATLTASHISNLEHHLENFKKHADALEKQSDTYKKQLEDDQVHLGNLKNHIKQLSENLNSKEQSLDRALEQIKDSNVILNEFRGFAAIRQAELNAQIAAAETELAIKKRKLIAIESSFSWRITKPLRYFTQKLGKK